MPKSILERMRELEEPGLTGPSDLSDDRMTPVDYLESVTSAPIRAAVRAGQEPGKDGVLPDFSGMGKAFGEQFGKDPDTAPEMMDIVQKTGVKNPYVGTALSMGGNIALDAGLGSAAAKASGMLKAGANRFPGLKKKLGFTNSTDEALYGEDLAKNAIEKSKKLERHPGVKYEEYVEDHDDALKNSVERGIHIEKYQKIIDKIAEDKLSNTDLLDDATDLTPDLYEDIVDKLSRRKPPKPGLPGDVPVEDEITEILPVLPPFHKIKKRLQE